MSYSTEAELRLNVKKLTTTGYVTGDVALQIAQADKVIKMDFQGKIDFTQVPALSSDGNFPTAVNLLAQYKTAQLCIESAFGAQTIDKMAQAGPWQDKYEALKNDIFSGKTAVVLVDGTSILSGTTGYEKDARPNTHPAFGLGKYGEAISEEDLEDERDLSEL